MLCAFEPDDGSPRWVNLAWPGYVTVITGVNDRGTMVALHGRGKGARFGKGTVPRSVMARHLLAGVPAGLSRKDKQRWAAEQLARHPVATSGFITHLLPQAGEVFSCSGGTDALELQWSDLFTPIVPGPGAQR